jgi:hypothetical protein
MMRRLKSDQAQLFYEFRLGDAVPEDHMVKFRKPSRIGANLRCSAEGYSFVSVEGTLCDGCEDRQENRYRIRTCSQSGGGSSTTR